jgi:hypothetical protein
LFFRNLIVELAMKMERHGLNTDRRLISLDLDAEWIDGGPCPVVYGGSRCVGKLQSDVITTTLPDGQIQETIMIICNNISTEHTRLISRRIIYSQGARIGG